MMFRVKEEHDGRKRYKAKLVVKSFQQIHKVDYNKIFYPVVKMTSIRLVLSIVVSEELHLEQLDVKIAFLHGDLDEDIYMTQTEGFQSDGKEENLVYKVQEMSYGPLLLLKNAVVFEMKDRRSKKQVLGYVLTVGVTTVEWDSKLQKNITKDTKCSIHLLKNLKVCSWANLVQILISEGSLSLLNILGTKSLAEMFTRD
ncbi:putative RNA-directed DNA polymerase, partial [Tanacetum coccineum]